MPEKIKISMTIDLPFTLTKCEDVNAYLASCPYLDVQTQGCTRKKAKENLAEALRLFFISCIERGTLSKVLAECNITPAKKPIRKSTKNPKIPRISIPVPLEVSN